GFGGGTTAWRLAEQGWRVCVLERGRRVGPGDFPDRPEQARFALWHSTLNPGGMFDLRLMKDLAVLTAAGVGGGSLVYANVQLRAPEDLFDDPAWPAAIDRPGLDRYYDRTEEALQPRETPDLPDLPKVRSFDAMGRRAGLSPALGTRFSGNGDALGLALDPGAEDVAGARTEYGPSMTSRLDYTADRGFMVADGGLPPNFGGLLEIVRGYSALTGWGRVVLRLKSAAARLGLTDRHVTHRNVKLKRGHPIGDSLVFLMIGRDTASGRMRLTPLLRCFDIRWSKSDSAELFAGMRQAAGELAEATEAKSFFALDAGPVGKFITVHPPGGCPLSHDPPP